MHFEKYRRCKEWLLRWPKTEIEQLSSHSSLFGCLKCRKSVWLKIQSGVEGSKQPPRLWMRFDATHELQDNDGTWSTRDRQTIVFTYSGEFSTLCAAMHATNASLDKPMSKFMSSRMLTEKEQLSEPYIKKISTPRFSQWSLSKWVSAPIVELLQSICSTCEK